MKVVRLSSEHARVGRPLDLNNYKKPLLSLQPDKPPTLLWWEKKVFLFAQILITSHVSCTLLFFRSYTLGDFLYQPNPFLFTLACVTTIYLTFVCLVLHPGRAGDWSLFFLPKTLKFACCFWNHFVLYNKANDLLSWLQLPIIQVSCSQWSAIGFWEPHK